MALTGVNSSSMTVDGGNTLKERDDTCHFTAHEPRRGSSAAVNRRVRWQGREFFDCDQRTFEKGRASAQTVFLTARVDSHTFNTSQIIGSSWPNSSLAKRKGFELFRYRQLPGIGPELDSNQQRWDSKSVVLHTSLVRVPSSRTALCFPSTRPQNET